MTTRIQELREEAGLTQQELAARAGLSIRTLSYIEAGRDVKISTLRKFADALAVPVADLLEEVPA